MADRPLYSAEADEDFLDAANLAPALPPVPTGDHPDADLAAKLFA